MAGGVTRRQLLDLAAIGPALVGCSRAAPSASPSSARGFSGASMTVHTAPLLHSVPVILANELAVPASKFVNFAYAKEAASRLGIKA